MIVRICCNIYYKGKVVIIDIGFCLLQEIIEIRKLFFVIAQIKKRNYWNTLLTGDYIDDHFYTNNVGKTDRLKGKIENYEY